MSIIYLGHLCMTLFRKNTLARRCLAMFLMFTSAAVPFHLIAAEVKLSEIGREAQSFGNMIIGGMGDATESEGSLYFPGSDQPLSINDLYPSTSGQSSLPASKFFADAPDIDGAKGVYDSDTDMTKAGTSQQNKLWADATSDEPSLYGAAYKILLDQKEKPKPSFHNDPMMNQTKDTYENIDLIAQGFGDCKVEDKFSQKDRPVQMPVYESCFRAVEHSGDYNIKQEYTTDLIEYVGGQPNYASCGDGCLEVWVGTKGDNYWTGSCTIYEEFTEFQILNQEAIQSVTLTQAYFDDYFQVHFNNDMIYTHTPGVFPPETAGVCERNTIWKVAPDVDITHVFKGEETKLKFKTRTSVTGTGQGYARITIKYDAAKVFKTTGWYPHKETIAIKQIKDGFCKNYEFTCNDDGDNLDAEGCISKNGVKVCPKDVDELHPEINPFCRNLDIKAECEFFKGQMDCWTDIHGEEHCPYNEAENMVKNPTDESKSNSCAELEANPQCGFIGSSCIEGAKGKETGTCYAYNERYDCGYQVNVSDYDKTTEYQCAGEISCMGSECLDIENTQSGDFSKAAALLNAAQHMGGDMQCDDDSDRTAQDDLTLSGCTVFKGEGRECKKALGGTVDCCEAPDNVNFGDYLSMLTSMPKIDAAILSIGEESMFSGVKSAYTALREPVVSTFQQSTGPLTSYVDNITGAVDGMKQAAQELLNQLGEKAKEIMIEAMKELGLGGVGEGAVTTGAGEAMTGNATTTAGAPASAGGLGAAMGSVITFVGWVYLVYQVAMLIIQIIYKCTKDELTLGVDRELKKCAYVGTYCASKLLGGCVETRDAYCCFPSPLARIILEEGGKQLGRDFGQAKSPQCNGLTLEEIDKIDWDKMNLDEWVGMLQEHDLFHGPESINIDKLTGSNVTLDLQGGDRLNAQERAIERLKGSDVDKVRQENANRFQATTGAP